MNNELTEIVAVNDKLLSSHAAAPAKIHSNASTLARPITSIPTSFTSFIKHSTSGIDIEVTELTNPELLSDVIKAGRYV